MAEKVAQSIVNEKCELLKSQREEVTVDKVRKLIGREVSIIDLVEKISLFKENQDSAIQKALEETESSEIKQVKDEFLELLSRSLEKYEIKDSNFIFSLRSDLNNLIQEEINKATRKYKDKTAVLLSKNDSLEVSILTLNKRYNELLEKFNGLKDESYQLKQDFQAKSVKSFEKESLSKNVLSWDDFKSPREQLMSLSNYAKVAVYDKRGHIIIKFPATDYLTQECRRGTSKYLQAKTTYDYATKTWILSGFANIFKTLNFLKRNKFVLSKELETMEYHQLQNSPQ
ncbi:hypothetical protein ACFPDQ_03900 [Pseudofrancisella aestuarii]|uniref:Uncharacterized protein n=1 Tax=Pseudofrancisella aestuarii TaxID=2670347 RepID=A0ABV9TBM0_9GAMM|nr:hypothetical protein [Pseudofrancisella aestuarii]